MITFKTNHAQIQMNLSEQAASNLPSASAGDRRYICDICSPKVILRNHSFWVDRAEWDRFVNQAMKVLTRNLGTAGLKGMSPGSFQLSIEAKAPQDILLGININDLTSGRAGFPKSAIFFEDVLDPEWTQSLIENLEK